MSLKTANAFFLYKVPFIILYVIGILFCVPVSLSVWFLRRKFNETSVAGVQISRVNMLDVHHKTIFQTCSLSSSTRSSGTVAPIDVPSD